MKVYSYPLPSLSVVPVPRLSAREANLGVA